MNKKVSVIIPTRNEENYIKECLSSLVNQSYPKDLYEILICDGRSNDGTRGIVEEFEKKYGFIKLIDNPGLTAPKGVNIGIKSSKSDIIILFGAHAYADKDFITNNVIKHGNDFTIGCVGGPIETINSDNMGMAISKAMSSPFGVGNALFRYANSETFVDTVAFGSYKRQVLEQIGLLDEELVRNQDDELNFRVNKYGYKVLLSPSIKSHYYSRSSLKALWKQYYQYGFWKVRVMQKHGRVASIRHVIPMLFVLFNIFGAVASAFSKYILYAWLLEVTLYLLLDLIYSIRVSSRKFSIFKYLIVCFPILHLSYGSGFINGLANFYIIHSKKVMQSNTKITR